MPKILIIKTSSLGDVIHALPAVTEAAKNVPDISFDWVVEKSFAEIPAWHPAVERVIPVALRSWRKAPIQAIRSGDVSHFLQILRDKSYDYIVDAQGLLFKSGIISLIARGTRCGFDWHSAREPLASLCYQRKFSISKKQHAINRNCQLLAAALGYVAADNTIPDYGIDPKKLASGSSLSTSATQTKNIVFIHGTSREDKFWPEEYWLQLAEIVTKAGFTVQLPWGSELELARANRIAAKVANVEVLAKSNLTTLANYLLHARAAVAVDTGLGHLAAALGLPTVSLYGNTSPALIGAWGKAQIHLTPSKNAILQREMPCAAISVAEVWENLQKSLW